MRLWGLPPSVGPDCVPLLTHARYRSCLGFIHPFKLTNLGQYLSSISSICAVNGKPAVWCSFFRANVGKCCGCSQSAYGGGTSGVRAPAQRPCPRVFLVFAPPPPLRAPFGGCLLIHPLLQPFSQSFPLLPFFFHKSFAFPAPIQPQRMANVSESFLPLGTCTFPSCAGYSNPL